MSRSMNESLGRRVTTLLLAGFAVAACSSNTPVGPSTGGAGSVTAGTSAGGASSGGVSSGGVSSGGTSSSGGSSVSGAATGGGASGAGPSGGVSSGGNAAAGSGGMSSTGGSTSSAGCDTPGLVWKSARKTWYESYPDPGSEECVKYNGCEWAGQFMACDGKKPEEWVKAHNIVAAFPNFDSLALHDLCLKSGDKTIVVTVLDTCGDDDCDGCCTENKGNADALIDLESYTNERWGVEDGQIEWADLGPTKTSGCD